MTAKNNLSIIVPIFNEQSVLPHFIDRLTKVVDQFGDKYKVKIILIDDGSRDDSWKTIVIASEADERFCGIRLSRNFGHQAALTCGYELAPGDVVISIDADLQDPPEVIPELVKRWEAGDKVVFAVRRTREGETRFKLWTAKLYYRVISRLSETEAPEGSGDFRLMDRSAVDAFRRFSESHRYIRGLVGWLGFEKGVVEYDRSPRHSGTTKYPLTKMMRLAMDGIVSLSFWPLRAAYIAAFVLMIPFLLYLVYNTVLYFFFDVAMVPGWPSLILATILFGTFNLLMLGILGEYTGRIYTEVKRRPIFLVAEYCGMSAREPADKGTAVEPNP